MYPPAAIKITEITIMENDKWLSWVSEPANLKTGMIIKCLTEYMDRTMIARFGYRISLNTAVMVRMMVN